MATDYTLYCFAQSGNCFKAALMLNLCGAKWKPRFVDFFNGETRTAEYRKNVNEMGEAPVLEFGGTRISQSGVILDYLAAVFGKFGRRDEAERREVLRWLLWDNHKFTSYIGTLRFLLRFLKTGETPVTGRGASSDYFGISPHGLTVSHVDALSHQFWNGKMYNDRPSTAVTANRGATGCSIEVMRDGIVTRGVLLDIAGYHGKPFLAAGERVFPEDLEVAEQRQGARLTSGDALLIRTGWYQRRLAWGRRPLAEAGL